MAKARTAALSSEPTSLGYRTILATYVTNPCQLGGITVPFTEAQLLVRYPTFADYYDKMSDATDASVAAGFLLPDDGADLMDRVCGAKSRWPADLTLAGC